MSFAPLLVMMSSGVAALIIIALAIEDGMQGVAWHHGYARGCARASLAELSSFLDAELLYIAAALCAFVIVLCVWLLAHSIVCGVIFGVGWEVLAATGIYALCKRRLCTA